MRVVHLSDPHILHLDGVRAHRMLLSKRFTGWVNLKLHRGSIHKREVVESMVQDIRTLAPDHVVISGDVSNLALEGEFELARTVFSKLGLAPEAVSIVPGNHDVYTHGAQRSQRFAHYFAANITSDRPAPPNAHVSGPFPFLRLRGPIAIVGISSAIARAPLIASGHVGKAQCDVVREWIALPEVQSRTLVAVMHHPLVNPRNAIRRFMRGLDDADAVASTLRQHPRVIALHGHLHDRLHHLAENSAGMDHLGATSASLLHPKPLRRSAYNIYDFDERGLQSITARVYNPDLRVFENDSVPRREHEPVHAIQSNAALTAST